MGRRRMKFHDACILREFVSNSVGSTIFGKQEHSRQYWPWDWGGAKDCFLWWTRARWGTIVFLQDQAWALIAKLENKGSNQLAKVRIEKKLRRRMESAQEALSIVIDIARIDICYKVFEGLPLWRNTSVIVGAVRWLLKTSSNLCRFTQFVIQNMMSIPFTKGKILHSGFQTKIDSVFWIADLEVYIKNKVFEEDSNNYLLVLKVKQGLIRSTLSMIWQEEREHRKDRLVIKV